MKRFLNMKQHMFSIVMLLSMFAKAQEVRQLAVDKPQSIADLKTKEGAGLVSAKWYVLPAYLQDADFKAPGASTTDPLHLYPTGMKIKTHTIQPQVDDVNFNKNFKEISPEDLEMREGMGLVSFVWFKTEITIPATIGDINTQGITAVFEITVDDYSEIWVNGKQAAYFGETGNGVIAGYNTRNRVVLTNNAKPGDKFSIAILGINGPLGKIPNNYIWIRNAVVDFYKDGLPTNPSWKNIGKIYTIDDELNHILPQGTTVDKVADGFQFTEGPLWYPDGYLLFSDPNTNTIYRYDPHNNDVTIYMSHSGYTGADVGEYEQPGSNGLA